MLVSSSDFRVKLERMSNSSQSTLPIGFAHSFRISLVITSGRVEFLSPDVIMKCVIKELYSTYKNVQFPTEEHQTP